TRTNMPSRPLPPGSAGTVNAPTRTNAPATTATRSRHASPATSTMERSLRMNMPRSLRARAPPGEAAAHALARGVAVLAVAVAGGDAGRLRAVEDDADDARGADRGNRLGGQR